MSSEVKNKIFPRAGKKLVTVSSYLLSKGYKPGNLPAMIEFAKPKKVATVEEWDKIFKNY